MTKPLDGVRVAITENRYPEQLAQLLERQGATVHSCPLLRETPLEDAANARRFMEICESTKVDFIIFYTGVGVELLLRAANKPEVLKRSKIIARGPKAVNALRKFGIQGEITADSPTTEGILQTLAREDLRGKSVLIQRYGQDNQEIQSGLESMGARVTGLSLYRYERASDTATIAELVRKIMNREVDAITFTSGPQARFLLEAAPQTDGEALLKQLNELVVVVSIGEVTSRTLRDLGIEPRIVPEEPKMGPMVKAMANFFEKRSKECSTPSS
ncbi:MAG TPA: uroporphyrinogen-III synthase [Terriglobia bacterium]|nr:uroporphyrinogen-III synthase [Terriglobia bacterium]